MATTGAGSCLQSWLGNFLPAGGTGARAALLQPWKSETSPNEELCLDLCSQIGVVEVSQTGKEEAAKGKKTAAREFLSLLCTRGLSLPFLIFTT